MINPDELLIGSYVYVDLHGYVPAVVKKIGPELIYGIGSVHNPIDWEDVHPITLTSEWLEDFGFEFNPRSKPPKQCAHRSFGTLYGNDGNWKTTFYDDSLIIEYVHQLQLLFKALTGEMLTKD